MVTYTSNIQMYNHVSSPGIKTYLGWFPGQHETHLNWNQVGISWTNLTECDNDPNPP